MHHFKYFITIEAVIFEFQNHHPNSTADKLNEIRHAHAVASFKHAGQLRQSGEPYINHPVRVALRAAERGFDAKIIIVCLLHDVLEDTDTTKSELVRLFSDDIADVVDGVTSIDKEVDEYLSKKELDKLSDIKLLSQATCEVAVVKALDRLDNLLDMSSMPFSKAVDKCNQTRRIIIPMLKKEAIGAFSLLNELEDAMIFVEHRDRYDAIKNEVDQRLAACSHMSPDDEPYTDFLNRLEALINDIKKFSSFSETSELVNDNTMYLSQNIVKFEFYRRSVASFYREIVRECDNLIESGSILTDKTPLYDVVLVISDDASIKKTSAKLFESYLDSLGCVQHGIYKTSYKDAKYCLISCNGTYYRFFIKRLKDYLKNRGLSPSTGSLGLAEFMDMDDPSATFHRKIKVFVDDSMRYIDSGATILDLALSLGNDGLHCRGAYYDNDTSFVHSPSTELCDGDNVSIIADENVTPSLDWFLDVNTVHAKKVLVEYFESRR